MLVGKQIPGCTRTCVTEVSDSVEKLPWNNIYPGGPKSLGDSALFLYLFFLLFRSGIHRLQILQILKYEVPRDPLS